MDDMQIRIVIDNPPLSAQQLYRELARLLFDPLLNRALKFIGLMVLSPTHELIYFTARNKSRNVLHI